jgi:hypothetical protein
MRHAHAQKWLGDDDVDELSEVEEGEGDEDGDEDDDDDDDDDDSDDSDEEEVSKEEHDLFSMSLRERQKRVRVRAVVARYCRVRPPLRLRVAHANMCDDSACVACVLPSSGAA